VENPVEFGIVITREDGTIERFLEKPTWGEVFSDTINTNIYVLEPEIFDFIPDGEVVDFSGDVFPAVLERGEKLIGHVIDGYWEDVGTLEAYRRAHEDILDGRMHLELPGFEVRDGVWLGEGADLSPEAEVYGPVLIGDNSRVEAGAVLRPYTVLGTDVVVKADAELERCVVHDHVYIGPSARLRGAVVGRASDIRDGARIEENVVIGDECFIGAHAIINPSVKVYPFKMVEPGALVTSSIVWESKGARTLFGRRGVRGLANVDITSEVAVRLAMAYGTALKKGAVVCTSRDTSRSARALKRAVIAGLNLSGVHVMDLELSTVPLTRFQVRTQGAQGGISVRLASGDPDSVEIRFMDEYGADIDEGTQRKIERLLYREDYRRAFGGEIGDIVFPPRSLEFYSSALERVVDIRAINERAYKIVVDYSYGAASIVMPGLLTKLGAEVLAANPYANTSSATASVESRDAQVMRVADLTRVSQSDLGFVIDPDGEIGTVVDDLGRVLAPEQLLLTMVSLIAAVHPGARVAVPVSVTGAVEQILGGESAVERTNLWGTGLMEAAVGGDVTFAGTPDGGCIWPDFLPAYDAAVTLMKLLDLLAADGRRLSEVVDALPDVHVVHETIVTPWERKGTVMREIMEHAEGRDVSLVDGVKVFERGPGNAWALVLPDPEEALTHVWAEAESEPEARRRAQHYAERIRQVLL